MKKSALVLTPRSTISSRLPSPWCTDTPGALRSVSPSDWAFWSRHKSRGIAWIVCGTSISGVSVRVAVLLLPTREGTTPSTRTALSVTVLSMESAPTGASALANAAAPSAGTVALVEPAVAGMTRAVEISAAQNGTAKWLMLNGIRMHGDGVRRAMNYSSADTNDNDSCCLVPAPNLDCDHRSCRVIVWPERTVRAVPANTRRSFPGRNGSHHARRSG